MVYYNQPTDINLNQAEQLIIQATNIIAHEFFNDHNIENIAAMKIYCELHTKILEVESLITSYNIKHKLNKNK